MFLRYVYLQRLLTPHWWFRNWDHGGLAGKQVMLTPPRHLIHPLSVFPTSYLCFKIDHCLVSYIFVTILLVFHSGFNQILLCDKLMLESSLLCTVLFIYRHNSINLTVFIKRSNLPEKHPIGLIDFSCVSYTK
jgi:hypothetical protein